MRKKSVLIAGAFPPPVHGSAFITEKFRSRLDDIGIHTVELRRENVFARTLTGQIRFVALQARSIVLAFSQLMRATDGSNRVVYIALACGWGQWIDTLICVISRLLGAKIYIHHHCYSYIDNFRASTVALSKIASNATHIFLCEDMKRKFDLKYRVKTESHILSNTNFLQEAARIKDTRTDPSHGKTTVGFLSNISKEKGIFLFFDVAERFNKADGISFVIAGPVSDQDKSAFQQRLSTLDNCTYLGPVYGLAKSQFFESVDLLLFPTLYKNEAEPVTLFEAMTHGVAVTSITRGCICDQVRDVPHCSSVDAESFLDAATHSISTFPTDKKGKELVRQNIAAAMREHAQATLHQLDSFLHRIAATND